MDSLTSNRPDTREALQKRYGAEAIPAVGPWNDTIALLLNHRSVRGYKPDPVPAGTLDPETVVTPGIYVNRILVRGA